MTTKKYAKLTVVVVGVILKLREILREIFKRNFKIMPLRQQVSRY